MANGYKMTGKIVYIKEDIDVILGESGRYFSVENPYQDAIV